jgi:hypothetical protein
MLESLLTLSGRGKGTGDRARPEIFRGGHLSPKASRRLIVDPVLQVDEVRNKKINRTEAAPVRFLAADVSTRWKLQ